jgi:hypothetical protein
MDTAAALAPLPTGMNEHRAKGSKTLAARHSHCLLLLRLLSLPLLCLLLLLEVRFKFVTCCCQLLVVLAEAKPAAGPRQSNA